MKVSSCVFAIIFMWICHLCHSYLSQYSWVFAVIFLLCTPPGTAEGGERRGRAGGHGILGLPHNLHILGPENESSFLNETWFTVAYLNLKETPFTRDYKGFNCYYSYWTNCSRNKSYKWMACFLIYYTFSLVVWSQAYMLFHQSWVFLEAGSKTAHCINLMKNIYFF